MPEKSSDKTIRTIGTVSDVLGTISSSFKPVNSATQSLSKGAKTANAIGMVAEIVGAVGTALITASYNKKNAEYQAQIESELKKLSEIQLKELRDETLKVADVNERLSVVVNYLADKLGSASALNLRNEISDNVTGATSRETKQIYWFIGVSIVLLIGIAVVIKIRK